MAADRNIEWIREGDVWPEVGDSELRSKLVEFGVLGPGQGGLRIRFVGAIVFEGRTLVSIPKVQVTMWPEEIHRGALRAMRRYQKWIPSSHEPSPYLNESPEKGLVSTLAAADWLITDFAAHGLYRRTEVTHEQSGPGITNWRRTVENVIPFMSRGRPVYVETITKRSDNDNRNFATRLHCFLLERLSAQFGPILDFEPIILDHEPIERLHALPSLEECKARLGIEQRATYSQRGTELLEMMLATVASVEMETELGLSLFGTSSFHHVWEAACASVFGNDVASWQPFIPKPRWTSVDGHSTAAETFIPDLIAPISASDLLIGDAKYYRPTMPPALGNIPGVNDVAKQIWYKQCLRHEADRRGYTVIQNVFLFPADIGSMALMGHVELPSGGERVDAVGLPFMEALAIYASDRTGSPEQWRESLSAILQNAPQTPI